jgi:hypothetical protein
VFRRQSVQPKTRYQMVYGMKPSIKHMNFFGCLAYVLLTPKKFVRNGIQNHGRLCLGFSMKNSNPVASPVDISVELNELGHEVSAAEVPYREAAGALMHLMCATRPDIAFAVGIVSRY